MAKKSATKPAAKKRPAKRKPVEAVSPFELSEFSEETKKRLAEILDAKEQQNPKTWHKWFVLCAYVAIVWVAFGCGVWSARVIDLSPKPVIRNDALQQSYDADRITQVAVLRELAKQPFDGSTDEGRKQAGEWFNAQRFRNRADDFGPYSDSVAEAIDTNSEDKLAEQLE